MMNTRSPYAGMVQQQRMGAQQPQQGGMQRQPPPGRGGGMMMSDEKSKEEIERLETANSALSKALASKGDYPNTAAPSSGMQALGQQDDPSKGSFPDAPATPADRVAAQNVGMQQQAPAPQAQPQAMAQPGQSEIRNPWGVQPSMPNMTDLDEAYARMGQGG